MKMLISLSYNGHENNDISCSVIDFIHLQDFILYLNELHLIKMKKQIFVIRKLYILLVMYDKLLCKNIHLQ